MNRMACANDWRLREGKSSVTFSHNLWTSTSANCLHVIKLSIQPSRVGIEAGSDTGDSLDGSGALPTSSMFVSMMSVLSSGWRLSCFGLVDGGELKLKCTAFWDAVNNSTQVGGGNSVNYNKTEYGT